ncbi:tetratricopeptide (TPR) repeat protein [Catenulispora sp. MAP12-49]|uniref:hypothetical protein n=1 Tax=Catenulispora sp. MAP12-49 TaxID=3156302 RepID=UPI0035186505
MEIVGVWTGRLAQALRVAMRMTHEDFAARLGFNPRGVAKWAAEPDVVLKMSTQQVLDLTLSQTTDDVKARFGLLAAETGEASQLMSATEVRTIRIEPPAIPGLRPASARRRLTPETLSYLRKHLQDQYVADNLLGPRVMLPGIIDHFETIEALRRDANGDVLIELLRLAAGYAEFAGWLCHDAGDLDGAASWCGKSLEMAQAGGDDVMAAFTMMRRAAGAISARDGAFAARLAAAVQRYSTPETIRVRAIAALTEAHGHALAANAGEADRALDLAAGLVEQSDQVYEGDPTVARYCAIPLYESISKAKCHLELGRAPEAIESFKDVLDTLPPDYHRDRGQYLARLTQSYVLGEQPEAACAAAEESLAIALETGSSRTLGDLRRTVPTMVSRWGKVPEILRFRDMLATVERSNGGA